ncbi:MAG: glycosyltransferase [Bacteroidetes bacterium]|jgi:glycosyltransferase involved in cell wall biosynthesis|nr:glycosyltransferase [Bacteroidota bacterium]
MKIFVLLSRIPWPLEKGDKLRAFNQLKQLSRQHEIVLCALNTDKKADKKAAFRALQPFCKSINFVDLPGIGILLNVIVAWINGRPLQTGYFYNTRAAKSIDRLIEQHQPDFLYGQLLRVAAYIRKNDVPKAIDYQDVFSMGMKRRLEVSPWFMKPFLMMEYKRLQRFETAVFEDFDLKTIISEPDRELIPHPERQEILIIPNGVDHDFFSHYVAEKKYDIVFTGNMAYPPNVNAAAFLAHDIMPIVWKSIPDASLLLAGASPDISVRQAASERVFVSGWMDDIRQAYAQSKVFVAPMRIGTGLQNKLLEAMSMGLPCVTTSLANKPLKAVPQEEILTGETAVEIAAQLVFLLQNPEKAMEIAGQGNYFVRQKFNWETATNILSEAIIRTKQKQD